MEHRNGCTPGDVFGKIAWGTRAHRRAGTVTFPLTDGEGSTRLLALRNEDRLDAPVLVHVLRPCEAVPDE